MGECEPGEGYKRPRAHHTGMQVFGITGPGSGRLIDRIADHTDDLAVVRGGEDGDDRPTPSQGGTQLEQPHERPVRVGATTYDLDDDGWVATGAGLTLEDVLDRLAPDHEWAAVVGFPDADVPHVVLGDEREIRGEELLVVPDQDAVDVDELLDRVDALEGHETLESLVSAVKRSPRADRAGAIATFTGRVREKDTPADTPTEYLEFEKHEGVADRRMADIEADLEAREGVYEVTLHHRTGVVPAGKDIVFVVVLAGHRREAFSTVEDGIDRLKREVPLFKKEVTNDGEFWVHEHQ